MLTGKDKTVRETAEDRARHTYDVLLDVGNAQAAHLAKRTGYHHESVKAYLRILRDENKVVSWRIGNNTWYSVARPPKRRK